MSACESGYTDIVKLFLNHSSTEESYLNVQSKFGETAFMLACQKGHKDVVKLFLDSENYIQLNARDFFGDNAFIMAHKRGQKEIVKLLQSHKNSRRVIDNSEIRSKPNWRNKWFEESGLAW